MSRFDRYLLSQLMVLFGFFALVLVSVYWVNRAVRLFDQLISDGQTAWVFLEFTALTLPHVIRLVLPVAAFAATVYTINRLNSDSELVVMQATGFSPVRLARPVVYFGLIVAVLMSVLVHVLVPLSRTALAERQTEITENITSRFLSEGTFLHPADGITLYIREITPAGELEDLFLNDARGKTSSTTYTADRALLVKGDFGPKLIMFNGMAQTLQVEDQRLLTTRFADFTYDIGSLITGGERGPLDLRELSTWRLLRAERHDLIVTGETRASFLYEGHLRLAEPLMGLVGALLGFSALMLGGFSRFGIWKQIGGAIALIIAVQVLSNTAADIAVRDERAWPVTYMPIVAGLAASLILLWIAGRSRKVRKPPTEVPA